MKHIIDITKQNRYGNHIWFEEIDENVFIIKSDKDWVLKYASMNYENLPEDAEDYDFYNEASGIKGLIVSFDPDGGPYMPVGSYKIDGKTLRRVKEINNETYFFVG